MKNNLGARGIKNSIHGAGVVNVCDMRLRERGYIQRFEHIGLRYRRQGQA